MADYRQDPICKECGYEYAYYTNNGCPRCAERLREAKIKQYKKYILKDYRDDPEKTILHLAEELARMKLK